MSRRQDGPTNAKPEQGIAEKSPTRVPAGANHDGTTPGREIRWTWVEPTVWTPRMVQALENGVKGNVWHSLMDKILSLQSLEAAFTNVKAKKGGAGVDHQSIDAFEHDKEQ